MSIDYTRPNKLRFLSSWQDVKDSAMTTINKETGREPSDQWIRKILIAEHSPIRNYMVNFKWRAVPYWVAMHFVRHHVGVQWYVGTQREDRGGDDRSKVPQTAMVPLEGYANAQALITISRKRLCRQASPETRAYWEGLRKEIAKYQPVLASMMVPECVYRGFCPEYQTCGYVHSSTFRRNRRSYTDGFRNRTDGKTVDPLTDTVYCNYALEEGNENIRRILTKHQNQVSQSDSAEDRED